MTPVKYFSKALKKLVRWIDEVRTRRNIVLVYSMGKVGSSSVYRSLRARLPNTKLFHVHFLSDHWLNERLPAADPHFHSNIDIGKHIRNVIAKHSECRLKVITLVREPITRDLSGIFENWDAHFSTEEADTGALLEKMQIHTHDYSLNWFDTEFRNFLNFDIYQVPFDKQAGYSIYKHDNADVLCIRLEDLDIVGPKAFREFLGIWNLAILHKNAADQKDRAALYKEIKKAFVPDRAKLSTIYSSKYVEHFYGPAQIEGFYRSWTGDDLAGNRTQMM